MHKFLFYMANRFHVKKQFSKPLNVAFLCSLLKVKWRYVVIYIYIEREREREIERERDIESTEPIDAVNILPLARFEPTTSTTPPSTTPGIYATNCATETSPKKDVQEALILTTPDAVNVVYWFFFSAWHLFRSQVKA